MIFKALLLYNAQVFGSILYNIFGVIAVVIVFSSCYNDIRCNLIEHISITHANTYPSASNHEIRANDLCI